MPSEIMDLKGLSFSEDARFPSERQIGYWKLDSVPDHHASEKSVALSPLGKLTPVDCQAVKSLEHPESFPMRDQKVHLERHAVGEESAANPLLTMLRPPGTRSGLNVQQSSYFAKGDRINMMAAQYENSLFSSSLSDLFSRKMRLSSSDALYGHSVDTVTTHYEEEEAFESLEEIEAQTIGNLLPNDDDLLSGVTDGLDCAVKPSGGNDMEELDLFSSVGGMDLGDDGSSDVQRISEFPGGVPNDQLGVCNGSIAGQHSYGEHPSRTLFVRNINSNVEDSELRAIFEQYGDIHTLYTACKSRGFVMISYYDIRAARNAMKALQNRPLRRRKLDIHYSIPRDNPSEKDINQGTLMVIPLDSSVSNDELHQIFGVFGEIKEIRETPHRSHHKFIEFYDVRVAEAALHALNRSDIAGKRIKVESGHPGGSIRCLGQQFSLEFEHGQYNPIVQQKSPPNNSGAVAHSANSSSGMCSGTILGSHSAVQGPFVDPSFNHGISSSIPNRLPSQVGIELVGNQSCIPESRHMQNQFNFDIRGSPTFHRHSLPEYHDGLTSGVHRKTPGPMAANVITKPPEIIDNRRLARVSSNGHSVELNEGVFGSAGNGSYPLLGHRYTWSNPYHANHPGMMWPNSPSIVNGIGTVHPPVPLHGFPKAPSHLMNTILPINSHHVVSAPTANHSLWDTRHAYVGESPEASGFHPHSLGSMIISNNSLHSMDFVSYNIFPYVGGNCMDMPISPKNEGLQSHHLRSTMFPGRAQMIPMMNPIDHRNERARSRRSEGSISQTDKKQYELDVDCILRGEDKRTTLMIKNIPNKYTSKMLLAAIDECHRGTYDFIYLPIDFKNKCNVGYAFINITDPSLIISFYQAFNGKKWEKFNSEKVASLAYARIQGKASLVAHFQNSSLMNEDKRCRPILFKTEGPNAGDQVPFPMGVNPRTRPAKARTITHEENHQESPRNLANEEDSSN